MSNLTKKIENFKKELNVSIVAHYYQKDEVFDLADFNGDSLELAKWAKNDNKENLIFCGVSFMGESVKALVPEKNVYMPQKPSCAMADMINEEQFIESIEKIKNEGIDEILPIVYINSSATIKAQVGKIGGCTCTSSNAKKIMQKAKQSGKKIFFLPDKCLGTNLAKDLNLKVGNINSKNLKDLDVICYDGFCSVHQLFEVSDIDFYKKQFPDIVIAVHPECKPEVCQMADFVGSTSQIINYVKTLSSNQKVAIGTEFNLVKRISNKNTYILSATKPQCSTMNETTKEDILNCLENIKNNNKINEITLDEKTIKWSKIAIERMLKI